MSVLIALALGLTVSGGPSGRHPSEVRRASTELIGAPAPLHAPLWIRNPAPISSAILFRTRVSRRATVSRAQRGPAVVGPRPHLAPRAVGKTLARSAASRAGSRHTAVAEGRGPPSLS